MSVTRLNREREAKLALLEALAASQRAVARMLESTADLHARFPGKGAEDVSAMLARLAGLQLRMCESLLGLRLRRVRRGRPSVPWLSDPRLRAHGAGSGSASDRTAAENGWLGAAESRLTDGREPE